MDGVQKGYKRTTTLLGYIENVRNLLNLGMMQVLKDLDELGYNCEWQIISARDVGACHLRERIWIVAWPKQQKVIVKEYKNEVTKERKNDKRDYFCCRTDSTIPEKSARQRIAYTHGNRRGVQQEWPERENTSNTDDNGEAGNIKSANSYKSRLERPRKTRKTSEVCVQEKTNACIVSDELANTNSDRPKSELPLSARNKRKSVLVRGDGTERNAQSTHVNMQGFWPTFATESERRKWWTRAVTSSSDWRETQSKLRRDDDDVPTGLDQGMEPERFRKERIKQLGNAIVPRIAEIIGRRILEIEKEKQ